ALRAAELLRARYGVDRGCMITLHKQIPVAAGLGGGSSDAAATLAGLGEVWGLGLTCAEYGALASDLGARVPYFLYGGACLIEGRGEIVHQLPDEPLSWYVLANPRFSVSTADVYSALRPSEWTDGTQTRALAARNTREMGQNGLQNALFRVA